MTWIAGAIGFFRSPVGQWVGIALAVLAFISWQRHDAARDATVQAREECRIEAQERTTEEVERQRQIAETVLQEARDRQAITEAELAELQERADELLAELRESGGTCPLDPDTLRRLRDIR